MSKVQVHVGSLQDMGKRFTDAWHRAEAGELVAETHVTFLDFDAMHSALSPRRLALLRHVRQQGATSLRALAAALGRDYKNVHGDAAALQAVGLLVRDGRKLLVPWDEVQANVMLT